MAINYITQTPCEGLRVLSLQGTSLHASYSAVTALIRSLGPDYVHLLAKPSYVSDKAVIEWFTEAEGPVVPVASLPEEERVAVLSKFDEMKGALARLSDTRFANTPRAMLLHKALSYPNDSYLFSVGGRPVLTCWGVEPSDIPLASGEMLEREGRLGSEVPEETAVAPSEPEAAYEQPDSPVEEPPVKDLHGDLPPVGAPVPPVSDPVPPRSTFTESPSSAAVPPAAPKPAAPPPPPSAKPKEKSKWWPPRWTWTWLRIPLGILLLLLLLLLLLSLLRGCMPGFGLPGASGSTGASSGSTDGAKPAATSPSGNAEKTPTSQKAGNVPSPASKSAAPSDQNAATSSLPAAAPPMEMPLPTPEAKPEPQKSVPALAQDLTLAIDGGLADANNRPVKLKVSFAKDQPDAFASIEEPDQVCTGRATAENARSEGQIVVKFTEIVCPNKDNYPPFFMLCSLRNDSQCVSVNAQGANWAVKASLDGLEETNKESTK